jgi:hypothetical protein
VHGGFIHTYMIYYKAMGQIGPDMVLPLAQGDAFSSTQCPFPALPTKRCAYTLPPWNKLSII